MEHVIVDFRYSDAGIGMVRKTAVCTCGHRLSQKVRPGAFPSTLITRMEKHTRAANESEAGK